MRKYLSAPGRHAYMHSYTRTATIPRVPLHRCHWRREDVLDAPPLRPSCPPSLSSRTCLQPCRLLFSHCHPNVRSLHREYPSPGRGPNKRLAVKPAKPPQHPWRSNSARAAGPSNHLSPARSKQQSGDYQTSARQRSSSLGSSRDTLDQATWTLHLGLRGHGFGHSLGQPPWPSSPFVLHRWVFFNSTDNLLIPRYPWQRDKLYWDARSCPAERSRDP